MVQHTFPFQIPGIQQLGLLQDSGLGFEEVALLPSA